MFALEKELNLLLAANSVNNNNNINNNSELHHPEACVTSINHRAYFSDGSDNSLNLNQNDSSLTLTDNQSDHVPSMPMKDEESLLLVPSSENLQQQCDDNQNNVNNRTVSSVNDSGAGAAGERIRVNLKQLLALYAKLKRQLVEFTEAKANEQSSYKAKCDEMSSQVSQHDDKSKRQNVLTRYEMQLMSLKLELDSRPTQEDFDDKVQQCNALRLELSNLTEQMTWNEKLLERLQQELNDEREQQMEIMKKCLVEREVQTEVNESTKEVVDVARSSSVLAESPPVAVEEDQLKSSTKLPQHTSSEASTSAGDDDADDDALNNHPKVLYEDELIVFKEKCTNLTTENVRLQREISEMRANLSHFHNNWLHNFALKYLVPVLFVFIAYILYLLK